MKKLLFISAVVLFSACETESDKTKKQNVADNPFYQEWDTPFQVPPFHKIKNEHYLPAFKKGMEENLAEVDAIVNNSEAPTFANTLEALEKSGKLLDKVQRVFSNLAGSNTNPKLQELQREISPMLAAHKDKITLNEGLFKRVETIWQARESLNLTSEQRKLLEDKRKEFVRGGALLNTEQKAKITEINAKISELKTAFGQNLLAETNGFELILEKADLDGLSDGIIQAAAETAAEKMEKAESDAAKAKYKDKYVFCFCCIVAVCILS
jgi:peptidyl-dipeptidase Dcp